MRFSVQHSALAVKRRSLGFGASHHIKRHAQVAKQKDSSAGDVHRGRFSKQRLGWVTHTEVQGACGSHHVHRVQGGRSRSEEHTSELQSRRDLVCRLLLEKKKKIKSRLLTTKKKKKYNGKES